MQAGPVDLGQGVAQLEHQGLLGLVHGEAALGHENGQHQQQDTVKKGILGHYFFSEGRTPKAGVPGRGICGSTLPETPLSSRVLSLEAARISSMVS